MNSIVESRTEDAKILRAFEFRLRDLRRRHIGYLYEREKIF